MKNLVLFAALIISSLAIYGQEVKVGTDKMEYQLNEVVEVTFEIDAQYDSLNLPEFENFKIIHGPTLHSLNITENGEKRIRESSIYRLQPLKSGLLKIKSPTYFIGAKKIEGAPALIQVNLQE